MESTVSTRLTIDVWADVLCPWCYLGEQRLSEAIARSGHADEIDLRMHTFQLDPGMSTEVTPLLDYLGPHLGMPENQARELEEGMRRLAAADHLPYEVDRPASSTFDMLRLVHLGASHGVGWEYLRAMQAEVFGGNFAAFAPETLVRLGVGLGIPEAEIRDVLATERYADDVRADHNDALRLGARGVPFTVLGMRLGIPGAVSVDQYASAIDQAWEQING
jgi:predicted DsbA family dithiol-disulfide isomerase